MKTHNQAAAEGGCSKGLTVHLKGQNIAFSDILDSHFRQS